MLIKLTGTEKEREDIFYTMMTNGYSYSNAEDEFIINNDLYKILKKKHKNIEVLNEKLCLAELEAKK